MAGALKYFNTTFDLQHLITRTHRVTRTDSIFFNPDKNYSAITSKTAKKFIIEKIITCKHLMWTFLARKLSKNSSISAPNESRAQGPHNKSDNLLRKMRQNRVVLILIRTWTRFFAAAKLSH